jgi:S1-C subfamily serine protease
MRKPAFFLLPPALLLFAAMGCAPARAQQQGAAASASQPSQPSQSRAPRSYTGLRIGGSASSSDAGGAPVIAQPVVRTVYPDSPGQHAGIRAGDVIIEVNGRDSREPRVLWMEPGVRYTLRIRRDGQDLEAVVVPLPPQPAPPTPAP